MTFEDWRNWTKVASKPVFSKAHGNEWVEVYVDDLAKATYLATSAPYPECATIVKVHYTDASGTNEGDLTIMAKMLPGYDPENNDWWYGKYDATGTKMKKQGKLMGCSLSRTHTVWVISSGSTISCCISTV